MIKNLVFAINNKGEAVMKQKVAVPVAGQNKSRRALGDIGNMVTLRGKQLPAATRPVTRSFCAQLLANAQKDAAEKKKQNVDNNRVGVPKKKAAAAAKPKAQPVPDDATIIEISPDTVLKQKPESSSNKKPQASLTSTLTARSKAACGLNYKPKAKNVIDIDAEDVDNELAVVEYVEDIYKFYKSVEVKNNTY